MFDSGAGMQVMESHGMLSVMVLLPPDFNETYAVFVHSSSFAFFSAPNTIIEKAVFETRDTVALGNFR